MLVKETLSDVKSLCLNNKYPSPCSGHAVTTHTTYNDVDRVTPRPSRPTYKLVGQPLWIEEIIDTTYIHTAHNEVCHTDIQFSVVPLTKSVTRS